MRLLTFRHLKTPLTVTFSFILGCMLTINLTPINKTCTLENVDREHNIMHDSKSRPPDLIVLILSAPRNLERRDSIRQTWLRLYRSNHESPGRLKVRHYFVVGGLGLTDVETVRLASEQSRHDDVLSVPMYDHYSNLTDKIKRSFQWLDEQVDYGNDFKYVLKCDDDSFVALNSLVAELTTFEQLYLRSNLQNALRLIESQDGDTVTLNVQINDRSNDKNNLSLYWGYFSGTARIKSRGKWKEKEWIASDRYVPYALGGGYVLSRNLVRYIARNANNLRSFTSEDISVGFWLAPVNDILRIHDMRFDTEWTTRGCKNHYLITHNVAINDMKVMFKTLLLRRQLCQREVTKRDHYLYNWKVPPSLCCKSL